MDSYDELLRRTLTMNSYDELLRRTLTLDSYDEVLQLILYCPLWHVMLGRFWLYFKPLLAINNVFNKPPLASIGHFWLLIVSIGCFLLKFVTHIHSLVRVNGATANNVSLGVALLLGQMLLDPG